MRVATHRVGAEGAPVLVIDDLVADPAALCAQAAAQVFEPVRNRFYPGVRAPISADYAHFLSTALQPLAQRYLYEGSSLSCTACDYSIVTQPPQALAPYQRTPHFDSNDPRSIAVVHYLCGPEHGGTSFYRHRSTGFEVIAHARDRLFMDALTAELSCDGAAPADYVNGDTPLFERLASFPSVFNRALVYLGISLHSGDIGRDFAFDPDPLRGRLTVTSFLRMS